LAFHVAILFGRHFTTILFAFAGPVQRIRRIEWSEKIFKSLGWSLSLGDKKDKPFASRFQALGVEFDLSTVGSDFFSVSNTTSRRDELSEKIASIIQLDELEPKVAESLRSRLLFAFFSSSLVDVALWLGSDM